ncbi:hypothetical protein JHK82_044641 [Glycine max]|nr:hypothetical protein JHK82_044641 [Glycine max]
MGVGRVKEEKGVVWHKIEKKVPKVSEEKHPDDPLKTTDQTINLGLIERIQLETSWLYKLANINPLAGATPKLVLQLMNVRGLSIAHVKSHLQSEYLCMHLSSTAEDEGVHDREDEQSLHQSKEKLPQYPHIHTFWHPSWSQRKFSYDP